MSERALYQLLFAMVACAPTCAVGDNQAEQVPALIRQLSSESLNVRRDAVKQLEPQRIGELEPQLAVDAVLLAVQDTDAKIRQTALGGLGLLTSAMVDAATPESPVAIAIAESPKLRSALESVIADDSNVDVVVAASIPLMAAFGRDPKAEEIVLDRTDKLSSPVDQVRLMGSLEIGGIDSERTLERLARYLDGAPTIVQHKAALLLLSAEAPPADRLDDFLRLMETPETFADPLLVSALPRFGVSPHAYLPRLLAMQERLDEELQKPREQRTLVIPNDAYWKQTLDEAIAEATRTIKAKGPS